MSDLITGQLRIEPKINWVKYPTYSVSFFTGQLLIEYKSTQ